MIILTLVTAALAACPNSQPCGNSCISWKYTCHQSTYTPAKTPPTTPKEPESYVVATVDTKLQSLSFSRNGLLYTCSSELPDDLAVGSVITTRELNLDAVLPVGAHAVWVFTYSPTGSDASTPTKSLNVSACSKAPQ